MSADSSADAWVVYIVRCADGTLYTGRTENVDNRVTTHNAGNGAAWTAARRPAVLVYQEQCASELEAIAREQQIKRWSRAKKQALIDGDLGRLHVLAKRRTS
jgi:predicted GIY-YIG superfamily endonuclease